MCVVYSFILYHLVSLGVAGDEPIPKLYIFCFIAHYSIFQSDLGYCICIGWLDKFIFYNNVTVLQHLFQYSSYN